MEKSIESAKEMGYSAIYLESLPDFSRQLAYMKSKDLGTLTYQWAHQDIHLAISGW